MLHIETKQTAHSQIVESMRFPNSYILMTHLKNPQAVRDVLDLVGLGLEDINTPNVTISGTQVKALIELNMELHESPVPYSIIIAKEFNVATHGLFGLAIASSKNLKEAAKATKKYSKLINPAVKYHFQITKTVTDCVLSCEPAFGKAGKALVEINMLVIHQFLQLAKTPITLEYVHFEHESSFPIHYYEEYFGCPVRFNCNDSRTAIKTKHLKSPMMFYDQSTARALDDQLNKALDKNNKTQCLWTNKVKAYVTDNIGNNHLLSRDNIAEFLNTSPRTLTRKLKQEGACYQTIIENLKCDMAIDSLKYSQKSISQISDELGFNEPQSFARAFKRWTGNTASSYRKKTATR